jgi:hypothetical protein
MNKTLVLWNTTPCRLVNTHRLVGQTFHNEPWRGNHYDSPKFWYLFTYLHGVTSRRSESLLAPLWWPQILLSYVIFKRYRQTDRGSVLLHRTILSAPHIIIPEHINQKYGRRPGPATDRMCTNTAYTPPHKVFRFRTVHTDDAEHTTPLLVLAFT